MKNRTTQSRTTVTRQESEQLDYMVAKLLTIKNAESARGYAMMIYHVVYPRTTRKPRHFTGRQFRVLASIKAAL